jgi:hypothetical protein
LPRSKSTARVGIRHYNSLENSHRVASAGGGGNCSALADGHVRTHDIWTEFPDTGHLTPLRFDSLSMVGNAGPHRIWPGTGVSYASMMRIIPERVWDRLTVVACLLVAVVLLAWRHPVAERNVPTATARCGSGEPELRSAPIRITDSLILSIPDKYTRCKGFLGPFGFFLPDFSGYTIDTARERFDSEVQVAYVTSARSRLTPNSRHVTRQTSCTISFVR